MTPEDVNNVLNQLVDFILRYAITLTAIGALSMALLEAAKALSSWRDRFHKRRLMVWLRSVQIARLPFDGTALSPSGDKNAFVEKIYAQLIKLTTAETVTSAALSRNIEMVPWIISTGNVLFALELDKMMGQIQDAADNTLSNPELYPELYLFLTEGGRTEDIQDWAKWARQPSTSTADDAALAKRQAETYARLRQFIRRRLDSFQLTTGYRWQTGNQVASVLLGSILLFGSLLYLGRFTPPQSGAEWLGLILASLLGGIAAPVAKDLVMALKQMRNNG